jgi:hypothetical protein
MSSQPPDEMSRDHPLPILKENNVRIQNHGNSHRKVPYKKSISHHPVFDVLRRIHAVPNRKEKVEIMNVPAHLISSWSR